MMAISSPRPVPWLAHLFWELSGLSLAGSPEPLSLTCGQFPGRILPLFHLPLQLTLLSPDVFGPPGPTSDPRVCDDDEGARKEALASFFFLGSGSSQGFRISHSGRGRPSTRPADEAKWREAELGFEPRLPPRHLVFSRPISLCSRRWALKYGSHLAFSWRSSCWWGNIRAWGV